MLLTFHSAASFWASWHDFVPKLREGDSSVFVLVHFLNDLLDFFLTHVKASAFNYSLKFCPANAATFIKVKRIECIINIEIWHTS